MTHLALAVGTRPNYVKAWPLLPRLEGLGRVSLVHTGQHWSPELFGQLFDQLGLRAPDVQLGDPGGGRRPSFAHMLTEFGAWCAEARPDAVVVVGDVDSTAACALGAHYEGFPVVHVEAGLRSFDRAMPEEVNRVLTDGVSSLLLASEEAGVENLRREGREADVRLVGNVMIDTLLAKRAAARSAELPREVAGLLGGPFGFVTLHRPGNVDRPAALAAWTDALCALAAELPLAFAVHPRTRQALEAPGLGERLRAAGVTLTAPLGYLQSLRLQEAARLVLTDSGGMQEETAALGTHCLTLRERTERPVTLSLGTSRLVGAPGDLLGAARAVLAAPEPAGSAEIPFWDGRASVRAAEAIGAWLG